jgi:hypothetical protein
VHAQAKKSLTNAASESRRPAGGCVYLIGSIVASSWSSPVLASSAIKSYAYFAAGNISVGFTPIILFPEVPLFDQPIMGNKMRRKVPWVRLESFTFWSRHVLASVTSTG